AVEPGKSVAPISGDIGDAIQCGRRAFRRCLGETKRRLERFDDEMARLRRGYYHSAIRAADLVYARSESPMQVRSPCRLHAPIHVLVILEVLSIRSPHPAIVDGHLAESRLDLGAADQAALEAALSLRDQCGDMVSIEIYAVGLPASAAAMREIAAF